MAEFLSTPSARRATCTLQDLHRVGRYFYPRPPRGGRRSAIGLRPGRCYFYPRPPRGGRQMDVALYAIASGFLSTPSARRATLPLLVFQTQNPDFYPRPPRGGRRYRFLTPAPMPNFYPRPPRGGRLTTSPSGACTRNFYPRPPRGGRRFPRSRHTHSILYFYPRPPRGGRLRWRTTWPG